MSKRAILYARVSTPQQAELYSLEYQLQEERAYAHSMGFTVVSELTDDQSGRKMERDNLAVAREMLARDEADVLVTWKLDRLHRSYVNTILLRSEIQKLGKELHYAQLKMKSGETAKQRLPEDIMALMAEIEADEISERTSMGKRQKALSGKWIGLNKPPYGYNTVGRGKTVTLAVNEEQAKVVRDIFTWYLYGDETGKPLRIIEIARKLTALGIPTPGDADSGDGRGDREPGKWVRSKVYRLLHQTAYSGVFYHFKRRYDGGAYTKNPNEDEWVPVPVPIIVDPQVFEAVQEKMRLGVTLSPRSTRHNYLVGRRIICDCGHRMSGTTNKNCYVRLDGSEKWYFRRKYRCGGYREEYRDAIVKPCSYDMKDVSANLIDDTVWAWVREEIANPQILKRTLEEIQREQRDGLAPQKERLGALEAHKETILEEMKRLALLYTKNQIPSHILDNLLVEQKQRLKLTEEEIEKTKLAVVEPLTDEVIDSLTAFSQDFALRLSQLEDSFEAKRAVIDGLDVQVVVMKKEGKHWLKLTSVLSREGVLRLVSAAC